MARYAFLCTKEASKKSLLSGPLETQMSLAHTVRFLAESCWSTPRCHAAILASCTLLPSPVMGKKKTLDFSRDCFPLSPSPASLFSLSAWRLLGGLPSSPSRFLLAARGFIRTLRLRPVEELLFSASTRPPLLIGYSRFPEMKTYTPIPALIG